MLVPIAKDASVSCISIRDPAIDDARVTKEVLKGPDGEVLHPEPMPVYARDRLRYPSSWRKTMAMKDGETPTEFIIGVIPPSELNRIEDECKRDDESRNNEMYWRCFLHGLRDVKNIGPGVIYRDVGGVQYVDPKWAADVFCGSLRAVAIEIGNIAWHWNNLTGLDAGN